MNVQDSLVAGGSQPLMDLLDTLVRPTASWANIGLVIGTSSAAKVKTTSASSCTFGGIFGTALAATTEVAFTATTHDIAASASSVQEACYLLSVNAAGTATLTMGAVSSGAGTALVPDCPADNCAIGYLRLAVAAGATSFDASTDLLSATHLTDTYYSIGGVWGEKFASAV